MRVHLKRHSPDQEQTELYDKVTKIQTIIIESISKLKKQKKYHECKHYMEMQEECEEYDTRINYYDKFWKMYLMNEVCIVRIDEMKNYITSQAEEIVKIQNLFEKHEKLVSQKCKRKIRRTAQEIQKKYSCPYNRCYKIYGSDVSLNLHIKLKHNGGSKTDRQKAAECIVDAVKKGQPIPKFRIELPPNFVEDCMRSNQINQSNQRNQAIYHQQNHNSPQFSLFRNQMAGNNDNQSSQGIHGDRLNLNNQIDSIQRMEEKEQSALLDQDSDN